MGEAILAPAAARRRPADHAVADVPPRHTIAHGRDRAGVFVPFDHTGAAAPFEEEVQVGAADAAMTDLEQQLVRSRHRRRELVDRDFAKAHEQCRRHRRGHCLRQARHDGRLAET